MLRVFNNIVSVIDFEFGSLQKLLIQLQLLQVIINFDLTLNIRRIRTIPDSLNGRITDLIVACRMLIKVGRHLILITTLLILIVIAIFTIILIDSFLLVSL